MSTDTMDDGGPPNHGLATPLKSFHLFSKLPAELRIKIWTLNLPPSRIVSIRAGAKSLSLSPATSCPSSPHHACPPSPSSPFSSSSAFGCTSTAKIPVNLHVCHESRVEALRRYRLLFGMTRRPGQIFFDPDRDVLYFGFRDGFVASDSQFATVMALCDQTELAAVRRLAINDALFWVGGGGTGRPPVYHSMSAAGLTARALGEIRARMPNLREITFVPREENPVYSHETYFVEPPMAQMRMHHQIETAFTAAAEEYPCWTPPAWNIMALGAEPEPAAMEYSTHSHGDDPHDMGTDDYPFLEMDDRMDEST